MNLKKEKRDETTASRHMSYLTILGTYMTIFGTVLGLVLSWGQLRLAHIESERARRAEPLSYSLEAVDTHYQYEIQKDGASMSIPAPSTRLQVQIPDPLGEPYGPADIFNKSIDQPAFPGRKISFFTFHLLLLAADLRTFLG